jgi:hypothetical protein
MRVAFFWVLCLFGLQVSATDPSQLPTVRVPAGNGTNYLPGATATDPAYTFTCTWNESLSSYQMHFRLNWFRYSEHRGPAGEVFTRIEVPGLGLGDDIGRPALPELSVMLALPGDMSIPPFYANEELLENPEHLNAVLPGDIYPTQPAPLRNATEPPVIRYDQVYYNRLRQFGQMPGYSFHYGKQRIAENVQSEWQRVPMENVTVEEFNRHPNQAHFSREGKPYFQREPVGQFREVRYRHWVIRPILLNFSNNLRIAREFEMTIKVERHQAFTQPLSPAFAPLYAKFFANWADVAGAAAAKTTSEEFPNIIGGNKVLVVCPLQLEEALQPWIDWTRRKGHEVRVELIDTVGQTYTNIRTLIYNQYQEWQPEYVLLVGGPEFIPCGFSNFGSLSDHVYSTLDGEDYLPDVCVARFSVQNEAGLQNIVAKTLQYERSPWFTDGEEWFTTATVIGSNDGIDDAHAVTMTQFYQDYGFDVTTLRDSWGIPLNDIADSSFNAGLSWIFFIGHGWSEGWGNYHFGWGNGELTALQNNRQVPAVISIACATADLDYDQSQSFAELWMDLDSTRGAANILASTENCAFFYTDTLGKLATYNYFGRVAETFGMAAVSGKMDMYYYFPEDSNGTTYETMHQFLVLGDPLQMPFTAVPESPLVTADTLRNRALGGAYTVTVTNDLGQPVDSALVCISDLARNMQYSARTNTSGQVGFALTALDTGNYTLVVTGYNLAPVQGSLRVVEEATSGLGEASTNLLNVFPNPATDVLQVVSSQPLQQLQLLDATGRVVRETTTDSATARLDVRGLSTGVYMLRAETALGTTTIRRVVVR